MENTISKKGLHSEKQENGTYDIYYNGKYFLNVEDLEQKGRILALVLEIVSSVAKL